MIRNPLPSIGQLITEKQVIARMRAKTKTGAIEELVGKLAKSKLIKNSEEAVERVLERERIDSTGVGEGVAFPHARLDVSDVPVLAMGRSLKGIDFDVMDGKPVNLIVLVIWQPATTGLFNNLFGELVKNFGNKSFRTELLEAKTARNIVKSLASIRMEIGHPIKKPFAKTRILQKLQNLTLSQANAKKSSEKKDFERQIKVIKSELDPDIVRRFERLIERDGKALWEIAKGTCNGCRLRLSNKYDQIVKSSRNIFICEHCGRFIYY